MISKLIQLIKSYQYSIFLALCLGLISFVSYNLGRIDALDKSPLKIGESGRKLGDGNLKADIYEAVEDPTQPTDGPKKVLDSRVVASKASTSKKYHYTWCSGAKRINESNKVWFNSAEEAEDRGYTLAGNCEK